MRHRGSVWLLAGVLLAAGCLGAGEDDEDNEDDTTGGDVPGQLPTGTPSADQLALRTLSGPPGWRLGEWWTVELDAGLTGEIVDATIVVAGERDGQTLFGFPADAFSDETVIMHIPVAGPAWTQGLRWDIHDIEFVPLQFPLEPGTTWSTSWIGADVEAEVVSVDEAAGTASVEMVGANTHIELTYDAGQGFITDMAVDGYGGYLVTDHGFGFTGPVIVPDAHDLVMLNARVVGVVDPVALAPGPPVESVDVVGDYDQMSLFLLAGNGFVSPDAPSGVARIVATHPDGTSYEVFHTPADGGNQAYAFERVPTPSGTWQLEYEVAGQGLALAEAVAYRLLEVDVPPS